MATFILSDVHGRWEDALDAISAAGVQKDDFVVQLGDLANCVSSSVQNDMDALAMVGEEIDLMLVGNHELPYFDHGSTFGGFYRNAEVDKKLHQLYWDGLLYSAYLHQETLISHAGITAPKLVGPMDNAGDVWDWVETLWHGGDFGHSIFRDVSRIRGGRATYGGMLWCDWNEMIPTDFPQIVGHTTDRNIRIKGNVTCIDAQGDIRAEHRTPSIIRLEDAQ